MKTLESEVEKVNEELLEFKAWFKRQQDLFKLEVDKFNKIKNKEL